MQVQCNIGFSALYCVIRVEHYIGIGTHLLYALSTTQYWYLCTVSYGRAIILVSPKCVLYVRHDIGISVLCLYLVQHNIIIFVL